MYGITNHDEWTTSEELLTKLSPLCGKSHDARLAVARIVDLEEHRCQYSNQDFDVLAFACSVLDRQRVS